MVVFVRKSQKEMRESRTMDNESVEPEGSACCYFRP
jgi:hypothetical protein